MKRTFKLKKEPFIKGEKIFLKSVVDVEDGLTVLVGCNGSGKTTMLRQMRKQMEEQGKAVLYYDYGKVRESKQQLVECGDAPVAQFASWVSDSEGEQIVVAVGLLAGKIGQFVRAHKNEDIFILLDAIDSGLSIDNIDEIKNRLFPVIIQDVTGSGHHAYIIVSANSFEMARDTDCVDAHTCTHLRFTDYADYRAFVIRSKQQKAKR